MVRGSEILDIIEVIYFTPALPVAIYICVKHGFNREAGWLVLLILSIIRIVGSSCGIAAFSKYNGTLLEVSLIMGNIGSATLVAAFTGITNRVADGSSGSPFRGQLRRALQLIGLVAIALGIVGGTKVSERNTSSSYLKAAVILIVVQFLATSVVLASCAIHFRQILDVDRKLFFCLAFALPFLFVRVIYSILAAFDSGSSTFSLLSTTVTAVVVRGCLDVAMEIVTYTLFVFGGLVTPKMVKGQNSTDKNSLEMSSSSTQDAPPKQQYMTPAPQDQGVVRH